MSQTISITPEEFERALNNVGVACRFSQEELLTFSTIPIVDLGERVLAYPVPTDNDRLTLSVLKTAFGSNPQRQPSFFDHPWYSNEDFMSKPAQPGWHLLMMDVLPESISQPPDYIRSVAVRGIEMPTAIEITLMLFLFYIRSGEQLLSRKHTWCKDRAGMGEQVTAGAFGRNGLFLSKHPLNYASRGLGICPKVSILP
jgi:hypothetical protein